MYMLAGIRGPEGMLHAPHTCLVGFLDSRIRPTAAVNQNSENARAQWPRDDNGHEIQYVLVGGTPRSFSYFLPHTPSLTASRDIVMYYTFVFRE